MKKTAYLRIQGRPVAEGSKYWIVSALEPFDLKSEIAGVENNVIHTCYFLTKIEALQYQKMCELDSILSKQIMDVEKRNKYEGHF